MIDKGQILTATEIQDLSQKILKLQQDTKVQLQILIIPELVDEGIEDFSIRAAEAYKLGDEKRDDSNITCIFSN